MKTPQMKKQLSSCKPIWCCKLYAHWITINYKKLIIYLLVMAFYSIMKAQERKTLLHKKLYKHYVELKEKAKNIIP